MKCRRSLPAVRCERNCSRSLPACGAACYRMPRIPDRRRRLATPRLCGCVPAGRASLPQPLPASELSAELSTRRFPELRPAPSSMQNARGTVREGLGLVYCRPLSRPKIGRVARTPRRRCRHRRLSGDPALTGVAGARIRRYESASGDSNRSNPSRPLAMR
jgi:hypothetical protein